MRVTLCLKLYDRDGDNSELLEDSGPRPYQFEPRKVQQNDKQDSAELYESANDPRTANDPQIGPQMILDRK